MTTATAAPKRLRDGEFVAIIAMLFATIAFSLDAMLPALGEIAEDLSPDAPNRAQLVIASFVLGMGIGTFFTGPLSDTFGRRPVIFVSTILYIGAAFVAWAATSLEMLLAMKRIADFFGSRQVTGCFPEGQQCIVSALDTGQPFSLQLGHLGKSVFLG